MEQQLAIWIVPVITVVGFVVNAAYLKGVFGTKIEDHDRRISHIENGVIWKDGCEPKHEEINRRLERLEERWNE